MLNHYRPGERSHGYTIPFDQIVLVNYAGLFGESSLMADMLHSIMTKLTAGFVILVILITGMTFLFTVGASTDKIQESTKQELLAIASITASDLNGDEMKKLEPGMESEVLYLMNAEQLAAMAQADHEIVKILRFGRVTTVLSMS